MANRNQQLPPNFNLQHYSPAQFTSRTKIRSADGRLQLPPNLDLQNLESIQHPCIGLKFTITPELVAKLMAVRRVNQPPEKNKKVVKPTASNFLLTSIKIGPNWQMMSTREGDLTAKLYFAKQKLIWEFLEGMVKVKIEVLWSDIIAINAHMPPNQPGFLRIQLGKPPSFSRETPPIPKKHTIWEPTSDFTDGHASIYRIHEAEFPRGELDVHYRKLLQSDQRLLELSRNPFPTHHTTFAVDTTAPPEYVGQSSTSSTIGNHQTAVLSQNYNLQALAEERETEQWLQELGSNYIFHPEMTCSDNIYGGVTAAAPEHVQQHSTAAAEYVGQSSTSSTIGLSHEYDEAALFPESSYNLQALAEERETEQWLQELESNYTFDPEMTYSDNIYGGATATAPEHVHDQQAELGSNNATGASATELDAGDGNAGNNSRDLDNSEDLYSIIRTYTRPRRY